MRLGDWLVQKNMSAAAFAERLRVDRASVRRWVKGECRPRWEQIAAIEAATNGRVTADDFMPPPPVEGQAEVTPPTAA